MLESYFKSEQTLERLRAEPTGRYIDDFAKDLQAKGYGIWAGQAYVRAAAHLGIWMKRQSFSVMKLDEEVSSENSLVTGHRAIAWARIEGFTTMQ